MWGSRDLFFGMLGPPNISGTIDAGNFQFGIEMEGGEYERKNAKLGKRGHVGVTWPTFVILGPPNISRMNKARNFKFGTDMVCSEY